MNGSLIRSPAKVPALEIERRGSVRFSVFSLVDNYDETRPVTQLYEEILQLAILAEGLGFYGFFVAEHHFRDVGTCPNPAILLTAIAAQTKHLRVGPAVSVLPLRDPRNVAEDYMLLDLLSGGRCVLGVGSGSYEFEFDGFQIELATKRERFDESLAILKQAITGKTMAYQGRYYSVENVAINVPSRRNGPMPLYVGGLSEAAARKIGLDGDNLMNTPWISQKLGNEFGPVLAEYRRGLAESGAVGKEAAVLIHCHVAETDKLALARVDQPYQRFMQDRTPKRSSEEMQAMKIALFGSADRVVNDVLSLVAQGADHVILFANFGAMPVRDVMASMETFATRVVPVVKTRMELSQRDTSNA